MEKKSEGKKIALIVVVVAIISAVLGAAAAVVVMKKITPNQKEANVIGTWYNSYAGETFIISLKDDNTFEFGYDGSEKTTGKYTTETSDVLALTTDSGVQKILFDKGKDYIEIESTKYYGSKEVAKDNDSYYFVPEDYDTSMFTKITAAEMIEKYKKGDAFFVLTARGSCTYCQQFRPIAAQSVEKYNYTLYYLDTTTLTNDDYTNIRALDDKLSEFGSTPNVYYFKGKTVADVQAGYTDDVAYGEFLEKNGVKAK